MKILIITLGNSDVQVGSNPGKGFSIQDNTLRKEGLPDIKLAPNRRYADRYLLRSPRKDGELINKNYAQFIEILHFPLISPLLDLLEKDGTPFHEVWLVYTDQSDADEHFRDFDTLFFGSILNKYFSTRYPDTTCYDYSITEKVKDIDFQYQSFYQKALSLSSRRQEIDEILLFPQGGIDQINHALTLQLIQLFKEKGSIYQHAELAAPVKLQFTHLFLNDLTKQNVIKHIRDYDFDKAEDLILDNDNLKKLAGYAASRLNLLHDTVDYATVDKKYQINWDTLSDSQKQRIKLQDLVYAFKIQMLQGKYNDAIVKLFIISECMYKVPIEDFTGDDVIDKYYIDDLGPTDINEKWECFISDKLSKEYLTKLKKKGTHLNNPNERTLCSLYTRLLEDKKIKSSFTGKEIKGVRGAISSLRKKRNKVAHALGSITKEEINIIFSNHKTSLQNFYKVIDEITQSQKFGIFETIRKDILSYYGESA